MFEFDQYLGFIAFLLIVTMGFWLMIFLMSFLPYWIIGAIKELLAEKKAKKQQALQE
ncbi:MAG: hypothetical protein RQ756_00735 [Flavobacteriaceae bacterium]|nr:hypothetical protein [Flavobacteriaceae bacterium]